ncbi:MAG: Ribosomal RNA small subunit methyltransferase A [Candidatus Moranbacteria bacterium GW2011_GWD2_36_12]|nr:MAG: Ribosomal RNA small subunit methyltransferase A [Candidatus Moranbacteria bacterium GW2011_GWD2_36_12]KKQ07180.1 MAG: Ribosomal RNA small subunit methyltransferase A [Candidatus Moranbacteria bacterium GW2011_GWE2_36_40]
MELKAKKSLGQNFLKDADVLGRIIKAANLSQDDVVIEVGPGQGVLTELLAGVCKKVIAIELDDRLIEPLHTKFVDNKNVEIIHDDILKINLPELLTTNNIQPITYKVVANIPYYITAPIIRLFLETKIPPSEVIFMVQKEVAERICAKPGAMSILAVSVQYYAKAEFLFTVFKESFEPVPKVDSAIIKITHNLQLTTDNKEKTKKFFRVVKSGFSAKRKTLINNLSNGLQIDKKEIEEKLGSIGFSPSVRAQELGVEDWKKLADILA